MSVILFLIIFLSSIGERKEITKIKNENEKIQNEKSATDNEFPRNNVSKVVDINSEIKYKILWDFTGGKKIHKIENIVKNKNHENIK